jgi:translation initiation factor 1
MSRLPLDELFGGKKHTPVATSGSVYSTDVGDLRKQQSQVAGAIPDGKTIRIHRSSGGRGGKIVSVIKGLPLAAEALESLCSSLKKRCGTGGSVVDGHIEIQGEQRELLVKLLLEQGFVAKLAGG